MRTYEKVIEGMQTTSSNTTCTPLITWLK